MALVEIIMPQMGESIMEATVLGWLKNIGDKVEQEESLLEVATDKVDTDVPSPYEGVLKEILVKEGDVIQIGNPIAVIETNQVDKEIEAAAEKEEQEAEDISALYEPESERASAKNIKNDKKSVSERFYSPLVKNIARQEKIPIEELDQIEGTGKESRVTKKDILAYVEERKQQARQAPVMAEFKIVPPVVAEDNDEIIEMDRMRKIIADRMLASRRISAHVTSFVEADVTGIISWRKKVMADFERKEKEKLTLTPIFIEAVVQALRDFPMVNVSVDGYKIIKRGSINIGMAVALPGGNLIVPVIRNADQLSLVGLAKKVNDYGRRARANQLKPEELTGGTYTITNIGTFGNISGTPIILQPQVGILALGAVVKKPAVIETSYGDMIGIRQKMILAHSYDHRVIDGSLGGIFVKRVAEYLEKFDEERLI